MRPQGNQPANHFLIAATLLPVRSLRATMAALIRALKGGWFGATLGLRTALAALTTGAGAEAASIVENTVKEKELHLENREAICVSWVTKIKGFVPPPSRRSRQIQAVPDLSR